MAGSKDPAVIAEGLKRFSKFKAPSDLGASTRSTIYSIAARHGSEADFSRLINLHNTLTNADEKEEVAISLTAAKDPKRLTKLIGMLKSDHIRRQDLIAWFIYLLRNRYGRPLTWKWLVSNWDWIEVEFGGDKRYSDFAKYPGSVFSHKSEYDQYIKFFSPMKDIVALSRDIELAEQEMSARIIWRTRNEASIKTWLKNHRS
jgi:aminopeptidase N